MTADRDLGRLLDAYFVDGPTHAPDRVLVTVTDRIERQGQRPGWVVRGGWRDVRPSSRLLVAVAAILMVAIIGATVVSISKPNPVPVPTPIAPSPTPVAPVSILEPTQLPAGRYLVRTRYGPTTFVLPGRWQVATQGFIDYSLSPVDAAPGDSIRVFFDMHIAAKDATCTEAPEPGIDTSVRAMVADLVADDRISVSTPVSVTIGGLTGQRLDVRIAPSTTKTCPFSDGAPTVPLIVDDADYVPDHQGPEITNGPFWGVGPGERLRLILLDRPGEAQGNVVFVIDSADGTTFDTLVAAAMPVIESFTFDTGT
jgi:hypothetical protein